MSAVATNTIEPIGHAPVAVALEIPEIPVVDLPDFDDADPAVVGDVFAGLVRPEACKAAAAANGATVDADDDVIEDDNGKASNDLGAPRGEHLGDENRNRRLRRIVGPRLFRARELSGYSQTEAATAIGYKTPAQLSLWETSKRLAPIYELIAAARVYNTSVDYLVGETHEPDRDPSAGARHAVLRGVRNTLSKMAELTVSAVDRHVRLIGPHANHVRTLLERGDGLLEALGAFVRHNHGAFSNMRGGASLQRLSSEFEAALAEARTAIRVHDALDADLARALAALGDADSLPANEAEAD